METCTGKERADNETVGYATVDVFAIRCSDEER
jgi:hypothetical protein